MHIHAYGAFLAHLLHCEEESWKNTIECENIAVSLPKNDERKGRKKENGEEEE